MKSRFFAFDLRLKVIALAGLLLFHTGCGGGAPSPAQSSTPPPVTSASQGPVVISANTLTVTSKNLRAKFNQGALVSLLNTPTNEEYVVSAGPNFVDMTLLEADGEDLTPGSWVMNAGNTSASIAFKDSVRTVNMTVGVVDDEISLRFDGTSTNPGVISILWGIFGLDLDPGRLVIPAQGGTYFDRTSTPNFQGLDYPVHWEDQMVVYQGAKGSVLMYARDPVPTFKRLHASRQTGSLDMAFEMFAPAPWPSANGVASIEWRMHGYTGDWKPPTDAYKSYLASLRPFAPAQGTRSWIKNIRGVVIFQTLDSSLLETVAQEVVPNQTVVLVADWRSKGFDIGYPDYTPNVNAKAFVDHAHQLGFYVMLHVNLLGVSQTDPAYPSVQKFQLKTADELKEMGWLWDEFPSGDPRRIAYISPASSQYRQLFIASIKPAIDALQPDALHLDAGGAIVNDGNGPIEGMNGMQGITQLHRDIIAAYPNLVLGGESTNEIIAPFNWLAQRWPANSPPHPISTYLLGDQVFFYGFLDQPAPDEAGFADYLNRYEGLGVIPVPIIVNASDLGPDRVRTHEFLQYMKMFQTNQYRPDWSSDWGTAKFKYRSADGHSEVTAEDDGNYLRLKQDSTLVYQRAHDSNTFNTSSFIQNWPAYDATKLFGTDPNRQYWLENGSFRPSDGMHLLSVPTNFEVTTSSFTTADYGYFEIAGVNRNWFDFLEELPGAKTGTIYNLTNFKVINGAVIQVGRVTVKGQLFNAVLQEYPPFKKSVGGSSFVEYSVPVPVAPKVTFNFSAALADGSGQSDGVLYGVQINGQTQWKQTILPGTGWTSGALDLTSLAGTTAKIKLLTHPGLVLNGQFDWSCWKDLSIATDFSTNTKLQVQLPTGAINPSIGDSATLDSFSGHVAGVSLHVPGALTVFSNPPPAIQPGQSLMDFPVTVWKASNEGLPIRFANDNSGDIGPVSSSGSSKRAIAAIPPRRGLTLLTVPVTLPLNTNSITLGYGLADPPPIFGSILSYSGVTFIGRANGQEIFRQHVETAGWQQAQIDLRPLSGKAVLFELQVDAENNQLFDFSYFTDLTIQ